MTPAVLANNLWILLCGLFVFMMTIAVGLLELGELGERMAGSLVKTILITGLAVLVRHHVAEPASIFRAYLGSALV
jgi:ammonia channel protein AmtB